MTVTASGAEGAGLAVTVKDAVPPSLTPAPAVTLTSGSTTSGASSLSSTEAVSDDSAPTL